MDSHAHTFGHVGLVVEDLDETVQFLALLGFDCGEPGMFSGEWIDRIIGLESVTVETVMARAPQRQRDVRGGALPRLPPALKNGRRPRTVLGSGIAFKVDDLRGVVDRVRGGRLGNGRGDRRLREHLPPLQRPRTRGLIVELAERLDGAPG